MFNSERMSEELRALKVDVTRLLSTAGEEMFDSSKDRAEALADQIKAALAELGETVSDEQEQLQDLIADRPITSLLNADWQSSAPGGRSLSKAPPAPPPPCRSMG